MRVVPDNNILVSGLLWSGAPARLLRLAATGHIELWSSDAILTELERVLNYTRLQPRIRELQTEPREMLAVARALLSVTETQAMEAVVVADPQDDMFLACAVSAGAQHLVSGDRHLLDLGEWRGIQIMPVNQFLDRYFPETPGEPQS